MKELKALFPISNKGEFAGFYAILKSFEIMARKNKTLFTLETDVQQLF